MRAELSLLGCLWVTASPCAALAQDVFDRYLAREGPVATALTFPVDPAVVARQAARVAGDLQQLDITLKRRAGSVAVTAAGAGRVLDATGDGVTVAHVMYVNHHKVSVQSRYEKLHAVSVRTGQHLSAGAPLGEARGGFVFGLLAPFAPGRPVVGLLEDLAENPDPAAEGVLVLVDHATYQAALFVAGTRVWTRGVAFGQASGTKEVQGDLKTPKGMYFVVARSTGPFGGAYADYYGGYWVKLNYPNAFDAQRGLDDGVVEPGVARAISKAWRQRKPTAQGTRLGGGIGFHGWASSWDAGVGDAHLSWGCIVLQPTEVGALHGAVTQGSMVVIF